MPPPRSCFACLAVVALLLLTGCARTGGEPFQPTHNGPLPLDEGTTVGQTINPAGDAITGLDVQVATYAAPADPDGTLTLALRDPDTGQRIARTSVAGTELADATWVSLRFDTPVDVPDVVLAELSWEGATRLAVWANTPASPQVRSAGMPNDPYEDGELVVDGLPRAGDLAFRVRGAAGPGAALVQLGEVVASAGSRLLAEPVFATLWVLAMVGGVALAVRGLRPRRS